MPDANTDSHANCDALSYVHAYTYCYSNSYSNADGDADTDFNTDCNSNSYGNSDSNGYTYRGWYSDRDAYLRPRGHTWAVDHRRPLSGRDS